jgi:hypothetical protein
VGQFCLTVTLQGGFIGLGGETKRIEETDGGKGTGDGVDREGRCRSGKKGKSGGDLHFVCVAIILTELLNCENWWWRIYFRNKAMSNE